MPPDPPLYPSPLLLLSIAAPSLLLVIRLGLAGLVLPLLYRALGREGEGWGGGPRRIAWRSGFALLGAGVFFLLTANWLPDRRETSGSGRGFQAYSSGALAHRASHSEVEIPVPEGGPGGVDGLRKATQLIPESAFFKRHLGIALADQGRYPEALKALEASADILKKRAPARAAEERHIWEGLYGPTAPPRKTIESALTTLEGYRLGWLARVAALAAYRRLPEDPPQQLETEVEEQARSYFGNLYLGAATAVLIIPQLGLIVLVVGLILVRTGAVKPIPRIQAQSGPILWESFILMMALGMVTALIPGRPVPETQPGAYSALLVLRDAVQFLAVGYLWWRLRSKNLGLSEVGLTTKRFAANVGVGALTALVMIPASYVVGIFTQQISDRFFPNIAPPYHPLEGMTATSGNWEIRTALFLLAVVGAPLIEETFFRGALYGALRRRFGVGWGLLGSSAFFAILHPQLPLGFLPIALLGAVFAGLYEWRQSLVPGMVAHAINNTVAFCMLNLVFPLGG